MSAAGGFSGGHVVYRTLILTSTQVLTSNSTNKEWETNFQENYKPSYHVGVILSNSNTCFIIYNNNSY